MPLVITDRTAEAMRIYTIVQSQVLLSNEGKIIDINFIAIGLVLDLYKIKNREQVFEDVLILHKFYME